MLGWFAFFSKIFLDIEHVVDGGRLILYYFYRKKRF